MEMLEPFSKEFYSQTAVELAPKLLGKILYHETPEGVTYGYIVETEAYMGATDRASHTHGGSPTERTQVLYLDEPGLSYVFQLYGIHYLFNVSCGPANSPECVLVRALEPLGGLDLMAKRRVVFDKVHLANGPGKLCKAMGIGPLEYGLDLTNSNLRILMGRDIPDFLVASGRRINVDYAGEHADNPWRFWVIGSRFVSK